MKYAPPTTCTLIPTRAQQRMVTQQAINVLTIQEQSSTERIFTPNAIMECATTHGPTQCEHSANPMVDPTTGEKISSYKHLMTDPEMAETWQTAFGKDFGGMAQGDNKMGQKVINTIFVMNKDEISQVVQAGKTFTYANPVVDH